jgi:molecular chaperone GrpE
VSRRTDQDRSRRSSDPGDEEALGHVEPSAELEAALREAAAAVPDPERSQDPAEVVLDDAVEAAPEEEAARLREELKAAHDRLLRLQADFENFRRRALRDREEALHYGAQNLVKDLLPVVDNLGRAIDHARRSEGGDLQGLLQGVDLVWRGLESVLSKHQVREIEAAGRPFNPALHEAMAQVPDASVEPNTIVEVLQKGYQLRERLVRPARVVVARAPDVPDAGGEASGES